MLIDTYKLVEDMIAAGIKKPQAEIITKAINQTNNNLVIKSDLKPIEADIKILQSEVQSVRSEITTLKWMVGLVCALVIMMLSLMITSKL